MGMGEALALLSAFSYAAASVCIAKSAASKGGDHGALLSIIFTAVVSLSVWSASSAVNGHWAAQYSKSGLMWFALSGVLTIILGRALFFKSIAAIGAIRASAVNRLNPFFSILLAAVLLGETITPTTGIGMLMVAMSFLILIREMLRRVAAVDGHVALHASPLAYAFGPASALSYALGYITRKFGLHDLPDPNLGTFVGASTGLAIYFAIAVFSRSYRKAICNLRTGTTRWHVLAAGFISVGQLAQFAALSHIEVSQVVMISSFDTFIAMFLSVYILKTESRPNSSTLLAAVIATVGVLIIAAN